VCVCVCVCVRERERERELGGGHMPNELGKANNFLQTVVPSSSNEKEKHAPTPRRKQVMEIPITD
jgi:hypothetical protein